jgi:phosphoribosylaminoimidazole (AIR) synthetase
MNYINDFTYLNGEYILKNFYKLNNINDVLKWIKENIHLKKETLVRIFNYGLIYYIQEVKYLQDEIINLLDENRNKLIITLNKNEIKKELEIFIEKYKNVKDIDKDSINYL